MKYLILRTLAAYTVEQIRGYILLYTPEPLCWYGRDKMIESLRDTGYGLRIMSIFGSLKVQDCGGNIIECPDPRSKSRYDESFRTLREIITSGIQYEILGDKEELEALRKFNPPLYDRIESHIIWKGIKKNET
jgi:hypothetical protein